jgi:HD-like signal output (HDOD) protein
MESGKIITSNEIIKNQLSSDFLEFWQKSSILEAEKEFFGSDSYEIASLLFEEWEFETSFVKLISNVQNPSTMEQKILHIICAAISVEGILEEKNITLAIELICEYGFDKEKFIKAIEALREESF